MVDQRRLSKRLSFWLRHQPGSAGLVLDERGCADVAAVLAALQRAGLNCDRDCLEELVASNDKQRFEFAEDGQRIRARQGHSVPVDLSLNEQVPPKTLYHGTVERFLPSIFADGLRPMKRHHVHLSPDADTARQVGQRRGRPVILLIEAARMAGEGHRFYRTGNNVWLVDRVPPDRLRLASASSGPARSGD